MNKIELLSPAGSSEKLQTAYYFGADACYFAGKKYGLRAFSDNFDEDELEKYIKYAHKLNKKAYITVNILAHNEDFVGLSEYLQYLYKIGADAIIVSDVGIINLAKKVVPNLEIHLSTQANCTNSESARFWYDLGIKRIVLARELSLKEIKEIKQAVPEIELEAFVHGAMCISYSGRCLLSNYLCNRDSNRGQCAQACRFEYFLREKTRQDEMTIQQDERGTYILNSKDMKMIEHLQDMIDAGITSLKIEGRMKTSYYVANVTNAYRRALDNLQNNLPFDKNLSEELEKSSHRRYTTGFYLGENDREYIETSLPISSYEFMANVIEDSVEGYAVIEQRNRFKVGDELEILSPNETFNKTFVVDKMYDEYDNLVVDALKVQQKLKIACPYNLKAGDLLRRKIDSKNIKK